MAEREKLTQAHGTPSPRAVTTKGILKSGIDNPGTHFSADQKNYIKLTEGTIGIISRFPELKRYFVADGTELSVGDEIQTDLFGLNPHPSHGEMMRTVGALEVIGLLMEAAKSDADAERAYTIFNAGLASLEEPMSLESFQSHAAKLSSLYNREPDAFEASCVAIVLSDLGKSEAFKYTLRELGFDQLDVDHDILMEQVLAAMDDETLSALCPSFGQLSQRGKFLVRGTFELELNPGWIVQGEAGKQHIEKFLHATTTLNDSYLAGDASEYPGQLNADGTFELVSVDTIKGLLTYGTFFSDVASARRNTGPAGTTMMNADVYGNFERTIMGVLYNEGATVDEAYNEILLGQARDLGLVTASDILTPYEIAVTRLAQLVRIKQHSTKGWSLPDLEESLAAMDDKKREGLIDALGGSGRSSFTITYLPGIVGRLTDMVMREKGKPTSKEDRMKILDAALELYANLYEAIERDVAEGLVGDHRVNGRELRWEKSLTPPFEGEESELDAGVRGFKSMVVTAIHPPIAGGTIDLRW